MGENMKVKKGRKLRQNFDFLHQALKNTHSSKKDKKINFSSDSKNAHNNSQNIPLDKNNYMISDSPASANKN